ncbi:MAG TPA: helix-turn-helix transcriptional regulator [Chitinophagaceae bacterium]
MFTKHSDLITQIHAIIQNNPIEEKQFQVDFAAFEKSLQNTKEAVNRDYYPFLNIADLKRLEQRMESLEERNNKLQCIIQFLLVQLTELKRDISNDYATGCDKKGGSGPGKNGNHFGFGKSKPFLTKRETEVFDLLAKGMCAKEIAKILFISETTVITHKKNLKEKFHAKNTVEMISNVLAT